MSELDNNVKQAIDSAIKMVKEYEEPYKSIAFEVVLKQNLGVAKPVTNDISPRKPAVASIGKGNDLAPEVLEKIYFDKDGKLEIITHELKAKSKKEKQIRLAYLYILGYKIVLGIDEAPIENITEVMKEFALYDTNFQHYLNKESWIRKKTNKEGVACYILTKPGEKHAEEIVKEIASAD